MIVKFSLRNIDFIIVAFDYSLISLFIVLDRASPRDSLRSARNAALGGSPKNLVEAVDRTKRCSF